MFTPFTIVNVPFLRPITIPLAMEAFFFWRRLKPVFVLVFDLVILARI